MFRMISERISSRALVLVATLGWLAGSPARAIDLFASSGNFIYNFDTATGNYTTILNQSGADIWGLAVDSNGNVYGSDLSSSAVYGRTRTGGTISGYTQIATTSSQNIGIALNPTNSTLAVQSYSGGTPKYYSLSGGSSTGAASFTLPNTTQGISYDAAGNLYAAQNSQKNVSKNGTQLFTTGSANPEFVYVDQAASKLYVTLNSGNVGRYDLSGNLDTSFGTNGFISVTSPVGVTVAGGSLFVTSSGSINKYDLSGNLVTAGWASIQGHSIRNVMGSISVPEPSTYALTTIATGVLAWAARRRKTIKV